MFKLKLIQSLVYLLIVLWIFSQKSQCIIHPLGSYREEVYTKSINWCDTSKALESFIYDLKSHLHDTDSVLAVEYGSPVRVALLKHPYYEIVNPSILDVGDEMIECDLWMEGRWIQKKRFQPITLLFFNKYLQKRTEIFKDKGACIIQAIIDTMDGITNLK